MKVDVSVQAPGLVRPVVEKTEITVPVSARVEAVLVRKGQLVREGTPIAQLGSQVLDDQSGALQYRLQQTRSFITDLERLTGPDPAALPAGALSTSRYARELAQLRSELEELSLRQRRVQRDLERAEGLRVRGFTTDGGAVAEEGAHDELLERRGVYYRLWTEQFRGAPDEDRLADEARAEPVIVSERG